MYRTVASKSDLCIDVMRGCYVCTLYTSSPRSVWNLRTRHPREAGEGMVAEEGEEEEGEGMSLTRMMLPPSQLEVEGETKKVTRNPFHCSVSLYRCFQNSYTWCVYLVSFQVTLLEYNISGTLIVYLQYTGIICMVAL